MSEVLTSFAVAPEAPAPVLADPIAMEVFTNRLLSITEEIGNTLIRASFSTNIKERRDCSVALFAVDGRLIAQASHVPLHLGSLMGSVRAVLAHCPAEDMVDGDAFVCNDPYLAGGTHTPDIAVVTPVFVDGAARYFAANIGHHSDIGGPTPGSISGSARSVFEEGLRIPVIRLVRGGVLDEDLLGLIAHNSREFEERALDLKVQCAANERGARLLKSLTQMMGADQVAQAIEDLLLYTAQRLRNRIREMADGEATFTSWLDHDGVGGDPVRIQATARVRGDTLSVDFDGTGPQTRGAMNVAESALRATVYYVVKTLLDPELLPNSGMFDGIEILAPEGTIVNPRYPAAVGARSITCNKIARALFGAFSPLLPREKAMAAGQDIVPVMVFSGHRRMGGGTFVYLESIGGGCGARSDMDGMDAIHVHMTNTSNLPIESLEIEYNLMVDEYALVEDSGGSGEHRGGLGIARQIRATEDGVIFTSRSDGHLEGAPGLEGGRPGRPARLIKNKGAEDEEELPAMAANLPLRKGESVRLETPGGGGFGAPAKRKATHLARDLRENKIHRETAIEAYGEKLVAEALALDRCGSL